MYWEPHADKWYASFSRGAMEQRFPRLGQTEEILEYPTDRMNVLGTDELAADRKWYVAADWVGQKLPRGDREALEQWLHPERWKSRYRKKPARMIVALSPSPLELRCRVRKTFPYPYPAGFFEYSELIWVAGPFVASPLAACGECGGKGVAKYGRGAENSIEEECCHTCLGLRLVEPAAMQDGRYEMDDEQWRSREELLREFDLFLGVGDE